MIRDEAAVPSPDVVISLLRETCERLRAVDGQLASSGRVRSLALMFFAFQFAFASFQAASGARVVSWTFPSVITAILPFFMLTILLVSFVRTREIRSAEQEAQGALIARLRRLVELGSQMHEAGDLTAGERLRLDVALADAEILLKVLPAAKSGEQGEEKPSTAKKPRTEATPSQTSPEAGGARA